MATFTLQSKPNFAAAPAKLSAPRLSNIVERTRLFTALDVARQHPVVWIHAPGGAGKTTLVASYCQARNLPTIWYKVDAGDTDVASFFYYLGLASQSATTEGQQATLPYLTAEYSSTLGIFTANYFRDFFARLPRPSVVVFDNYQNMPSDGWLHAVLAQGLDLLPPGINAIVVSREEPQEELFASAVRASRCIALIDWEETRLTEQESEAILRARHGGTRIDSATIAELHRRTQGWVAGLVLLTEWGGTHLQEGFDLHVDTTQSIFDYFATEIFCRASGCVRNFLLKTSLLPKLSIELAARLAGNSMSECVVIFRELVRRNLFTVQHGQGNYEYHPLFRAFLIRRMEEQCSAEQINELRRASAHCLLECGDVESGIALLQEAKEWEAALKLILVHACSLTRQGRTRTLQTWLDRTPPSLLAETPWALYWQGMCNVGYSSPAAREKFERAYALFEKQSDSTPLYLTWSRIVESYVLEMDDFTAVDRWMDLYPALSVGRTPPTQEVEDASVYAYLTCMRLHRPDHPGFLEYLRRAERIFEASSESDSRSARAASLGLCYGWLGDVEKMEYLLSRIPQQEDSKHNKPITQLYGWLCKLIHAVVIGASAEALHAVHEGLNVAQSSGVHLLDVLFYGHGQFTRLYVGEVAQARRLWKAMALHSAHRGRGHEQLVRQCLATLYIHEGAIDSAVSEATRARQLSEDYGFQLAGMGNLLCYAFAVTQQGNTQAALEAIAESRARATRMNSKIFEYYCAFCEAHVRRRRGELGLCIDWLRTALSLGHSIGAVTPVWCRRNEAVALYLMALEVGIETDYVRATIARTRLPAPQNVDASHWPWPIRIFTLGRFMVLKNDVLLPFSGKGEKKAVALLRCLLSLGGRDVEGNKLARELWPDIDAKRTRRAFRAALYRLRKLLGEDALLCRDGRLSLNEEYCWLDMHEFERRATQGPIDSLTAQARKLCEHYRGAFLDDDNAPWSIIMREHLRAKFVRIVAQLGLEMEGEDLAAEAVHLYEYAIELEPAEEEFYLRLMRLYRRLDRDHDAIAVYRHCCAELKNVFSTGPSTRTAELFAQIQNN